MLNPALFYLLMSNQTNYAKLPPESINLNTSQIIEYFGYTAEKHIVETEDGYKLSLQRISHSPADNRGSGEGCPVLLMHGLFGQSSNWVINGPESSLAFQLANAGYDVWLGNVRGNVYSSRSDGKYNPTSKDFWQFSFDEMAKYDLPAMINYVYQTNGRPLFYAAHSQGTTLGFIAFSENYNEIASKVKAFFALAPAVYLSNIANGGSRLSGFEDEVERAKLGIGSMFTLDGTFHWWVKEACYFHWSCKEMFEEVYSSDISNINQDFLKLYVWHNPAGTSLQNILHFGQLIQSKKIQPYDYIDATLNYEKYGKAKPTEYDVTKLMVPTMVFYGTNDRTVVPEDALRLISKVPKDMILKSIPVEKYAHADFIWAEDANIKVYNTVIKTISNYECMQITSVLDEVQNPARVQVQTEGTRMRGKQQARRALV